MRIEGRVEKFKGRGTGLDFPTANIAVRSEIQDGIYVGWTAFDGTRRPSLVFIGAAITFGQTDRKAEVHILDFDGDLYGREIQVDLVEKIRENEKFSSKEALVKQMQEDERIAREYFAKF